MKTSAKINTTIVEKIVEEVVKEEVQEVVLTMSMEEAERLKQLLGRCGLGVGTYHIYLALQCAGVLTPQRGVYYTNSQGAIQASLE